MALYTGTRLNRTPNNTQDEWTLDAASGEAGALYFVEAGGEGTSSAFMRTRWTYSSGAAGSLTALDVLKTDPVQQALANLIAFGSPYATTQPTLGTGDWFAEGWNVHGGLVRYQAAVPGDEAVIIGPKTFSCRTVAGVIASDYIAKWREF